MITKNDIQSLPKLIKTNILEFCLSPILLFYYGLPPKSDYDCSIKTYLEVFFYGKQPLLQLNRILQWKNSLSENKYRFEYKNCLKNENFSKYGIKKLKNENWEYEDILKFISNSFSKKKKYNLNYFNKKYIFNLKNSIHNEWLKNFSEKKRNCLIRIKLFWSILYFKHGNYHLQSSFEKELLKEGEWFSLFNKTRKVGYCKTNDININYYCPNVAEYWSITQKRYIIFWKILCILLNEFENKKKERTIAKYIFECWTKSLMIKCTSNNKISKTISLWFKYFEKEDNSYGCVYITKWLIEFAILRKISIKTIVSKHIIENIYWNIDDKIDILSKLIIHHNILENNKIHISLKYKHFWWIQYIQNNSNFDIYSKWHSYWNIIYSSCICQEKELIYFAKEMVNTKLEYYTWLYFIHLFNIDNHIPKVLHIYKLYYSQDDISKKKYKMTIQNIFNNFKSPSDVAWNTWLELANQCKDANFEDIIYQFKPYYLQACQHHIKNYPKWNDWFNVLLFFYKDKWIKSSTCMVLNNTIDYDKNIQKNIAKYVNNYVWSSNNYKLLLWWISHLWFKIFILNSEEINKWRNNKYNYLIHFITNDEMEYKSYKSRLIYL